MFDMASIGRKISAARKNKNMTQMELADKLNISFQAVSNWERGISMPDISKLSDITSLLDLSIDELLGKVSVAINAIASNDLNVCMDNQEITSEEIVDAATILKPKQVNDFFEKNENLLNIQQIERLLPFLGTDICNNLFLKYMSQNSFEEAERVAPFVKAELINQIVPQKVDESYKVGNLIAFMDSSIRDSVILKLFEKNGIHVLNDYLPFASKSLIEKIASLEYEKNQLRYFEYIVPFMDKDIFENFINENYL